MNVHNAVSQALVDIRANHRIREEVEYEANNDLYMVKLTLGVSELVAEIIVSPDQPVVAGVLRCVGFGQRFQERFMDRLLSLLD